MNELFTSTLAFLSPYPQDPCSIDPDPSFRPVCREFHVLYSLAHAVPTLYLRAWRSGSYIIDLVTCVYSALCVHAIHQLIISQRQPSILVRENFRVAHCCRTFFFPFFPSPTRRKLRGGRRAMERVDCCRTSPVIRRI
jgi:hypothetical protein